MTSSLPNFAAAPATASAAPVNAASLADRGAAGPTPPTGDFADFLPVAGAVADCPQTATATPTFTVLAPTFFTLLAPPADPAELAAMPEILPVDAANANETATPATKGISRDTMEQAASLLAALVQTLLPEAAAPAVQAAADKLLTKLAGQGGGQPPAGQAPERTRPGAPQAANQAMLAAAPVSAVASAATSVTDASPDLPAVAEPDANSTAVENPAASTPATSVAAPEVPTTDSAYAFEAHLAADGAVEINAPLPAAKEQGSDPRSVTAAVEASGSLEIQAELMLPGHAVIRLAASAAPTAELRGRANFAGRNFAGKNAGISPEVSFERNFLLSGDKEVTMGSTPAGIAVAKTASTMKSAPTEETRATSNLDTSLGLPARGEFTVAWPSVDRQSTPPTISYEQNFAQRAVATVSNLVDTQFSASMQKAGSVQLRLKFGGEDLSVRVELRDGAVHTDFRTDSPELRAALHREWQAVASESTDSLRRFIEPVFSPSANGDSSTPFGGRQQQQQAAQQDLSQQPRTPRTQEEDTFTFTRRSLVGETFAPPPAALRVPALLPTSVRLSVLA